MTTDPMIIVVAHPKEARNPVGTLAIVRRLLRNSRIFVGTGPMLDQEPELERLLKGSALLYPSPDALEIGAVVQSGRPIERIVVVDGTWAMAKQLIRTSVRLATLPRVTLKTTASSRYRIRRQPAAHCLSTVEAVFEALEAVRPRAEHRALLDAFSSLIDLHLGEMQKAPSLRRTEGQRARLV